MTCKCNFTKIIVKTGIFSLKRGFTKKNLLMNRKVRIYSCCFYTFVLESLYKFHLLYYKVSRYSRKLYNMNEWRKNHHNNLAKNSRKWADFFILKGLQLCPLASHPLIWTFVWWKKRHFFHDFLKQLVRTQTWRLLCTFFAMYRITFY